MLIFYVDSQRYKYFVEYVESLSYASGGRIVGYKSKAQLMKKVNFKDKISIHVFIQTCPIYSRLAKVRPKLKFLTINTEQLTSDRYNYMLTPITGDYSDENLKYLHQSPKIAKALLLPYQYNPKDIYNYPKNKPVCTINAKSPRRAKMLNMLRGVKVPVKDIRGFGKARDILLFKHKILVNIHFRPDYNIMEQIRINRCILNKMIVISEPSEDYANLPLSKYMIICPYNDIPKKVQYVLKNYKKVHQELFKGFKVKEYEKYAEKKLNEVISYFNV